ncbi:CvpA family protein [Rickettsiales endosymbiont of Stachyamoeba lipophora]|uniref:CvpA family protein n=1 Tax=Rickettsiales endosymbiont of Stachyamoeba lipophora TaxID=2486578 RepID=UPI000F649BEF|nr:CvpA family protein [Rickettsiales endosymbiont of Stachyamoeba lipophora]AZL16228.1 CvpA family protein [Rickettsiales endosymbiont of Stachyamoeba lipophora]
MVDIISLNYFDYFCLAIVGFSIVFAFFKGFLNTILGLVRFILALVITFNFSYLLVPLVRKYIAHLSVAEYVAFIALFMINIIVLSIIKHYIIKALSFLDRGFVDRTFGALFGLIRGVVIVCCIFFGITSFTGAIQPEEKSKIATFSYRAKKAPKWIQHSHVEPQLLNYSKIIISMLPNNFWQKVIDVIIDNHGEEFSLDDGNLSQKELEEVKRSNVVSKINKLLGNKDFSKDAVKLLQEFNGMPKEKQRSLLEIFLANYNEKIVDKIDFEDHKKILELVDKLQANLEDN